MRVWYKGCALAFQANDANSSFATRSIKGFKMTHRQKRLKDVAARLSKRFFVSEELRAKLIEFQKRANKDGKFDFEVLFDFKNRRVLDIREVK